MSRTWPSDWEQRVAGVDCAMCASSGQEDNGYGLRILDGAFVDAYLQRKTPQPGYAVAIWKHGHVVELDDLDDPALAGYTIEVARVGGAIQRRFRAAKMNYLTLGNALPHLHTHVQARFLDDPAPGSPLRWEHISTAAMLPEERFVQQVHELRHLIGHPPR
jgi:diadenosine tetraphosphate (Ap4A) HIT family hydrolase